MIDNHKKNIEKQITRIMLIQTKESRLWQRLQNRAPFGMIGPSGYKMSLNEKSIAFISLKHKVREMGYGFIELKGGSADKVGDGGSAVDIANELTLMVPNIKKDDLIKLGKLDLGYGPQDVVLYYDGAGFLRYFITNPDFGKIGHIEMEFEYDKSEEKLIIAKEAISQYFFILKKGVHSYRALSTQQKQLHNFVLFEMRDRRYPKNPNGDWWDNFGMRIQ